MENGSAIPTVRLSRTSLGCKKRYAARMISPAARTLLAILACGTVAACSLPRVVQMVHLPKWAKRKEVPKAVPVRFPKPNTADASSGKRRQIGTILLVNAEAGFVLIETRGGVQPEAGMALKCIRDGADSGVLIVSGERQGSHVIADITTGTPKKGDQVFQ